MAGTNNLNPVRSVEEAKAKGRNGGIASGKTRRERKAMKETLAALLSMPLKKGKSADIETIKSLAAVKGKNITVQEAIMLAQIQKAMKGDTRAAEFVRDSSGNRPIDDVSLIEQMARIEKIKAEISRIKGENAGEEMPDDGFMDALRGEVSDVWQEE